MIDVLTEITIASPIEKVAQYAINPDNAPNWYVNIKSAKWKTPKPLTVGSQIIFKSRFLGRRLFYIYEVVELIPNQKLVMQTADGPFPMETTYTWVAVNDKGTRMTLRNTGNPSGFSKFLSPFMALIIRKTNKKDLKKIKAIIESKKEHL